MYSKLPSHKDEPHNFQKRVQEWPFQKWGNLFLIESSNLDIQCTCMLKNSNSTKEYCWMEKSVSLPPQATVPSDSSRDNHTDSFPSVFPETWQTCTHIYLYLYKPLNSYMSRITQRTLTVFKSSCMSKSPREVLRNIPKVRFQSRPMNSEAPGKEPRCWHVMF